VVADGVAPADGPLREHADRFVDRARAAGLTDADVLDLVRGALLDRHRA
jgi:hypothetical protein